MKNQSGDYAELSYRGIPVAEYASVLVPWTIERYRIPPRSRVLDLGCGQGQYVTAFRHFKMEASGIDDRKPDIGMARWIAKGNIEKKLLASDDYYDIVFSKSVIEHLYHPERMIEEAYRVLRPGGRIIVLTPDWRYCVRGFYADCTQVRPFTRDSLAQMLELCGFNNIRAEIFRPSIILMRHPRWRRLLVALTYVLPYWWLGRLRFAHRLHLMALASGVK